MSVQIETDIDQPFPRDGGQITVEVGLRALEKTRPSTRHVVLLVDTSKSMGMPDEKINRARKGVIKVLEEIDDDDWISIIAFDSSTHVIQSLEKWGNLNRDSVYEDVEGTDSDEYDSELSPGHGTDIYKGLKEARSQFEASTEVGNVSKEIILLSDGKDRYDVSSYANLASEISEDGISIAAAGIGSKYNEEVILALARDSGGESYDLQDPGAIDTFMESRIQVAGDVVASNPTLHIEMTDEFAIEFSESAYFTKPQIQEKPIESSEKGAQVDLPQLIASRKQELTFDILGPPQPTGLSYHAADLVVTDSTELARTSLNVDYRDDPEPKTRIAKKRTSAKVTAAINNPSVEKEKVRKEIAEIEKEKGWASTAKALRDRLDEASKDGGAVRISKAKLEEEDT